MRGYKVISFEQFKQLCGKYKFTLLDKQICDDQMNHYSGCDCCASFCFKWRKLSRADIKVSKITKHNSESKPCRVCGSKFTKQVTVDKCESCGALK